MLTSPAGRLDRQFVLQLLGESYSNMGLINNLSIGTLIIYNIYSMRKRMK